MIKLKQVFIGAMLAATSVATLSSANADTYPPHTINMVAPSGAGGGWDLTIRTVAKTLKDTGSSAAICQ